MSARRKSDRLKKSERLIAGATGAILLVAALILVVVPPGREVALQQCANASAGCIVSVDSDPTALAAAIMGAGFLAIVIAVLGIRFNSVKAAGAELSQIQFEKETEGLSVAMPSAAGAEPGCGSQTNSLNSELEVKVEQFEEDQATVGVAVTRLSRPMSDVSRSTLRAYQLARRSSQNNYFLTHILSPPTQGGQKYSVAILVTPQRQPTYKVKAAAFYLGPHWGNEVFSGSQRPDGRFGMLTEAYGPFTVLCEIEFEDGSRILLDHFCDFDMGGLILP
jgi:hypothetical protein